MIIEYEGNNTYNITFSSGNNITINREEIIELKNSELVKNIDNANNLISIGNLILEEKDE
jgi:hypothetical protein